MSESDDVLQGGCLCGRIRYQIGADGLRHGTCHCKHCQRQGGSAFSTLTVVKQSDFTILQGQPSLFIDTNTASGNTLLRYFCNQCGSPIYSAVKDSASPFIGIKSGTLDDTSSYRPTFQLWCESKQDWLRLEEDVPQMARQ